MLRLIPQSENWLRITNNNNDGDNKSRSGNSSRGNNNNSNNNSDSERHFEQIKQTKSRCKFGVISKQIESVMR